MNPQDILIKPILTEKSNKLQEKQHRYTFKVDKRANKLEIKTAIEAFYRVTVISVNTAVIAGKRKTKQTKSGLVEGVKPSYKKAIVRVAEGESIDLYSNI